MKVDERKGNLILSGIIFAIGIYVVAEARSMPYEDATVPGPGFFPLILGVMLCGVSFALMAKSLLQRRVLPSLQIGHFSMVPILLGLLLLAGLLERVGFLPTVSLFIFLSLNTLSDAKWWLCILWGILAAFAAYSFFHLLLGIALPYGTWW